MAFLVSLNFPLKARELILTEARALMNLAENLPESLHAVVNLLAKISGKVVCTGVGKSSLIAEKISGCISSIGVPSFFIDPIKAVHGDLGAIDSKDCLLALSYSGMTQELLPVLSFTRSKGIPSILMTAGKSTFLTAQVDHILCLPLIKEVGPFEAVPSTSAVMMMAMGDVIVSLLAELKESKPALYREFHPHGTLGYLFSPIKEVMHTGKSLPLVRLDQPMGSVIVEMSEKCFGCAGVVSDDGALKGIISDGDLRRCMTQAHFFQMPARDVMTSPPRFTPLPDMLVTAVMEELRKKNITFSFVVDPSGIPIGFFRMHDYWGIKRHTSC